MALSGVHIACCSVTATAGASLVKDVQWSETLTANGATVNSCPTSEGFVFEIASEIAAYIAISRTPDAVNGPRLYIRAGETRNVIADAGDKVAWATA